MKKLCILLSALLGSATILMAQSENRQQNWAIHLLQQNVKENPNKNICLSPISAELAICMAANGAKENTLNEMLSSLGFENKSMKEVNLEEKNLLEMLKGDQEITVELANSIWVNDKAKKVKRAFIKANQKYFNAEVARLTFNADAAKRINQWCADHTKDKITKIIDEISPSDMMFLINALYFKGTWSSKFDAGATSDQDFFLTSGQPTSIKMMYQQAYYPYAETDHCQIIDMPFRCSGDKNYTMSILLPKQGLSADALLQSLDGQTMSDWYKNMKDEDVRLSLPKFKMEYETSLNQTLKALGIHDAFASGMANFSGMCRTPLYINQVLQKTFLEVTEHGAEAAAVTAITMSKCSMPAPHEIKTMNINRPFLFLIAEKNSGSMLFIGKIENPAN